MVQSLQFFLKNFFEIFLKKDFLWHKFVCMILFKAIFVLSVGFKCVVWVLIPPLSRKCLVWL